MLDSHYQYINDLVLRAQADDAEALVELDHFYQPLINASITRCVNRERALRSKREDIEREAFIVLHELVMAYDSEAMTYFSYYLSTHFDYKIQTRCNKLLLSYSQATKGIEEVAFSEMPKDWNPSGNEDPFNKIWMQAVLTDALSKLNSKQRDAIELSFYQNLTQEQAAAALGINQASFCKRLQRALKKLKSIVPPEILD